MRNNMRSALLGLRMSAKNYFSVCVCLVVSVVSETGIIQESNYIGRSNAQTNMGQVRALLDKCTWCQAQWKQYIVNIGRIKETPRPMVALIRRDNVVFFYVISFDG